MAPSRIAKPSKNTVFPKFIAKAFAQNLFSAKVIIEKQDESAMMRLESSYDQALIERCLYQIQIFFEMGIVERHAANEMIKESFFSIDYDHKAIWSDADSMVELFVEHFLKPLKAIVPDAFGFAAMLVVVPEENTDYDFRIVSREQMQEFIQAHLHDRDPRVSLIGDWLFVIRMDKFNLLPEPEE